jgi:hypothetical protein
MLNAVGKHLLQPAIKMGNTPPALNITTLTPMAAARVACAFAFFNVQNPPFYQVS